VFGRPPRPTRSIADLSQRHLGGADAFLKPTTTPSRSARRRSSDLWPWWIPFDTEEEAVAIPTTVAMGWRRCAGPRSRLRGNAMVRDIRAGKSG